MKLAGLVLACAACSGLEQASGTCGDGVVDRGEDCDSGPDCRDCSIVCASNACPPGYACGVDQLCHAPGGRFPAGGASANVTFQVLGFGVTDADGDGYNDVVGLSRTSLDVLHGDEAGKLARESTAIIPQIDGPPSVTHIDGDTTLDLVIPTADGLIAYTSPYGVISPYPFPLEIHTIGGVEFPKQIISLDGHYLAAILNFNGVVNLAVIDGSVKSSTNAFLMPTPICPGIDARNLSGKLFDAYDVPVVSPALPTHVIAMATTDGTVCTVELKATGLDPPMFAPFTIGPSHQFALVSGERPLLARLQNSACPSLVGMTGAQVLTEFKASGTAGSCAFTGQRTLSTTIMIGAPVGRVPLNPAFATEGPDALATRAGIFTIGLATANATPIYTATRPIDTIASLDVDGDGDTDVVVSAGLGFDDLDVLYRYGTGLPMDPDPSGFLDVTLDTLGTPYHLLAGDFDGDGIGDVTYTEALTQGERLMVAFGTRDQLLPPKLVSTYNGVITTRTIRLSNSADPTGTKVDDLIVLDTAPTDPMATQLLTILYGSPQRSLIPFFDPRPPTLQGPFIGAISGVFTVPDPAMPKQYLDLLGIQLGVPMRPTQLYRILSTPNGAMTADPSVDAPAISFCSPQQPPAGFCGNTADYYPYRRDPAAPTDVVLGADNTLGYNLIAIDPFDLTHPAQLSLANTLEPGLAKRRGYVADIDGDGLNELIIGYGPAPGESKGGHIVTCTYDTALACQTLEIPGLTDADAGWTCIDAAPARIVDHQRYGSIESTSRDLAVLCQRAGADELFRVTHDAQGFHATPLLALSPFTKYVQIGDVTGDGVDDVLAFEDLNTLTVLHVYPQCTSRQSLPDDKPGGCPLPAQLQ